MSYIDTHSHLPFHSPVRLHTTTLPVRSIRLYKYFFPCIRRDLVYIFEKGKLSIFTYSQFFIDYIVVPNVIIT